MTEKPEALRLAAALDAYWGAENGHDRERQAAAELRRQLAEHEEDQRVIAVWRGRTQRAEAQRDALLEACQTLVGLPGTEDWQETLRKAVQQARAAIKSVEGENT